MLKKIYLLSALALYISVAKAQSVNYDIISDNPSGYKPTAAIIELFNADTYVGASIGYGARLETVLLGRIMPWAQFKYSYLDANAKQAVTGYPESAGGLKNQLITEVGGALFLRSKEKKRKLKVVLSSITIGRTTHTSYIRVPGTIKKMYGVEGGINYNRRALEFDDDSHELYNYKSASGQKVPMVSVANGGPDQPAGLYYMPLSMTNVVTVFGGVRMRSVADLRISADGRRKACANVVDIYADLMLAPVVPIADVVDISGAKWEIEPKSGAVRNLGWRVGLTNRGPRFLSFMYNFEVGQRPGPKMGKGFMDNGTYVSIGLGFSLGFRKII